MRVGRLLVVFGVVVAGVACGQRYGTADEPSSDPQSTVIVAEGEDAGGDAASDVPVVPVGKDDGGTGDAAAPACPPGQKAFDLGRPRSVIDVEQLASVGGGSITTKGLPWSDPSLVKVSDDQSASVQLTYPTRGSRKLVATNFTFAIPANAKIDGIRYEVERRASALSQVSDLDVRPLVGGAAILSVNLASSTTWGNFDAQASYGGPTETFGYPWKASDVNDVGFGLAFAAWTVAGQNDPAPTAYVDAIRATVFYTCPP